MNKKVIVTGGGGFIGGALARTLRTKGFDVVSLSRKKYIELEKQGIESVVCDLSVDKERLVEVTKDALAIFHVAAKVDMWGKYEDFFLANVVATRNVIEACQVNQIQRLIYTSSPSVITDGKNLNNIDESYPYPRSYLGNYSKTKAQAEKEVLAANSEKLHTISLRPHLIWGPGDNHFVPTIIERARKNRLIVVGKGENIVDLTYIDDCVSAHIKAFEALITNPQCRGKAYFISQGDPVGLWDWINQILDLHNVPKVQRKISLPFAYGVAWVLEKMALLGIGPKEPLLTRFLVKEMATNHYFNISAAKRDLGYEPQYSIAQALRVAFA
jgi:2-alkyl-3-oxoalkanoate reductase